MLPSSLSPPSAARPMAIHSKRRRTHPWDRAIIESIAVCSDCPVTPHHLPVLFVRSATGSQQNRQHALLRSQHGGALERRPTGSEDTFRLKSERLRRVALTISYGRCAVWSAHSRHRALMCPALLWSVIGRRRKIVGRDRSRLSPHALRDCRCKRGCSDSTRTAATMGVDSPESGGRNQASKPGNERDRCHMVDQSLNRPGKSCHLCNSNWA